MSHTKVQKNRTLANLDQDFESLVLEHHQAVRLFLARYVHCPQRVDDLAQETFVAAFKQRHKFRNESTISTWLMGIARKKALQFLRTEKRRLKKQTGFFAYAERIQSSLEAIENESGISVFQTRLELLSKCLEQLPEKSRQLVRQYYFDQSTAVSLASQMNEKASSVRMKLKRIRAVLQKCIASKLQD